jgi:hypothetical protein
VRSALARADADGMPSLPPGARAAEFEAVAEAAVVHSVHSLVGARCGRSLASTVLAAGCSRPRQPLRRTEATGCSRAGAAMPWHPASEPADCMPAQPQCSAITPHLSLSTMFDENTSTHPLCHPQDRLAAVLDWLGRAGRVSRRSRGARAAAAAGSGPGGAGSEEEEDEEGEEDSGLGFDSGDEMWVDDEEEWSGDEEEREEDHVVSSSTDEEEDEEGDDG